MAGQIKVMIDKILNEKSKGNETIKNATKTKLMLKGINVDLYTATSPDDEKIIAKLKEVAKELGVNL